MIVIGKHSKTKGSGYELKIAKFMSNWWGGNFSRVPASGGLQWGSDQRVAGDIVPPAGLNFPFVIECKKREEWTFDHILLDIGQPKEWWAQVVRDARRISKVPLLIFSRNRQKDFVMIPFDVTLLHILESLGNDYAVTSVTIKNIRDEVQRFDVLVTTFETFSNIDIKDLQKYADRVQWDPYEKDYSEEGQ